MDRTLLGTNSALLYTRYRRDRGEIGLFGMLRVLYWLAKYSVGAIDAEKVALIALRDFNGVEAGMLSENSDSWFRDYALEHVREHARSVVQAHREAGDVLAIVTGATAYAAGPLARELGIDHVVCSELEVDDAGRFTGRPIWPLCYGRGKVERSRRLAEELDFKLEEAVFYSDSITDLPLLEQVGTPVVVCPDRLLRREARRRSWRIEQW
jgi:HAD superfamily hydrolase (TIGR01490 family)